MITPENAFKCLKQYFTFIVMVFIQIYEEKGVGMWLGYKLRGLLANQELFFIRLCETGLPM